jgi:hypothetical protein
VQESSHALDIGPTIDVFYVAINAAWSKTTVNQNQHSKSNPEAGHLRALVELIALAVSQDGDSGDYKKRREEENENTGFESLNHLRSGLGSGLITHSAALRGKRRGNRKNEEEREKKPVCAVDSFHLIRPRPSTSRPNCDRPVEIHLLHPVDIRNSPNLTSAKADPSARSECYQGKRPSSLRARRLEPARGSRPDCCARIAGA